MLPNPFSEHPVTPPQDTDPAKNRTLVSSFLGPEATERFAALDTGTRKPNDDPLDLEDDKAFMQETKFERLFDLDRQYAERKSLLFSLGLLETLPNGEFRIKDTRGKEYPFPSLEAVKEEVFKNKEVFEKKAEQGFTDLRITPFALPIRRLFDAIETELRIQHEKGTLHSTDGTKLRLDTKNLLDIWDGYETEQAFYFATDFTNKETHGGKTKEEILDATTSTFSGFLVSFVEQDQTIPREGYGNTKGGRPKIEAGQSPNAYLDLLKTPPYKHESGLTIEEWAIRFLTALRKDGTVLDDWDTKDTDGNENASACYNLATFFPKKGVVSRARWLRGGRRARVGGDLAARELPGGGACSSVRVGDSLIFGLRFFFLLFGQSEGMVKSHLARTKLPEMSLPREALDPFELQNGGAGGTGDTYTLTNGEDVSGRGTGPDETGNPLQYSAVATAEY